MTNGIAWRLCFPQPTSERGRRGGSGPLRGGYNVAAQPATDWVRFPWASYSLTKVVVETPVNLTAKQKELLREFDESINTSKRTHDPRASTWLDSVKNFFDNLTS